MQRRVVITELRPECREAYIEAHQAVWPELLERYREAGFHKITCHLLGNTLVVVTEAEDIEAVSAVMAKDPTDQRWQAWMATMRPEGADFLRAENVYEVTL